MNQTFCLSLAEGPQVTFFYSYFLEKGIRSKSSIFFFYNSFISTLTKTTYNVKQILQYNTYITTMSYTKHPTNNYVTFLIIIFFFHNHSYFIYNTSYL